MSLPILQSGRIILRRSLDTILFLVDILAMKFLRKRNSNAHSHLLSTFYLFGGFVPLVASKWLGSPKIDFSEEGILSKFSEKDLKFASKHLKDEGFIVLQNVLSAELCSRILKESEIIPGKTRIMDGGKRVDEQIYFNREAPAGIRFDYESSDLISSPVLQQLIFDESILRFAQNYLGSAPILDLVAMWWHTTFSTVPDKEAAQWFHFDMDRLKWIKFFFYITDVDTNTGPHTFIARSHRKLGIPFSLRKKGYVRLTDQEVASSFLPNQYKEFTGKGGTLIVEDTRGLHKGKHCVSGDRLLFQLEFTASDFGIPLPEFVLTPPVDRNSIAAEKIGKYQHVYQAIRFEGTDYPPKDGEATP
ncbi:hypothetical protein A1sIIA65_00180 [Candidatus Planktophila dulcis]|uniref:phytanoyl-CoA dioxygenase n=1 Tax=Candidatus Planktophila dulcis TaxID=1884914 RepID=UPI000BACDB31|nr:phytanoyl-CoA dioxygenase [Candidatus Planktophila dulcis]ASY20703.1 hypothetical protein A1sIIA65_00180 [Candidatus Planktophila dulcis]